MATDRFPLLLDLTDVPVLVVGGGTVASRRVPALLAAGAVVTVVAPELTDSLRTAAIRHEARPYVDDDLAGQQLVLACTDDPEINARVHESARSRGLWCVRADSAADSSAWVPASGRVDDVLISVSAGGDPRRAVAVRDAVVAELRDGRLPAPRGRRRPGVVLVGGGPGDPGLLTLRGYRELLDADVVVHDRLGPTGLLAGLPADVEVIDVGKSPGAAGADQEEINALIVARARAGARVVRLKGGDPFVFGRGGEEVIACRAAGVPVDVIPGVSSATSAATLAGIPLTHRGTTQTVAVVSGHAAPRDPRSTVDWAGLAASGATLVMLMAVENLAAIAEALIAGGRPGSTPLAAVSDASLPTQRVVRSTLGAVSELTLQPPAVVVVGDVVDQSS